MEMNYCWRALLSQCNGLDTHMQAIIIKVTPQLITVQYGQSSLPPLPHCHRDSHVGSLSQSQGDVPCVPSSLRLSLGGRVWDPQQPCFLLALCQISRLTDSVTHSFTNTSAHVYMDTHTILLTYIDCIPNMQTTCPLHKHLHAVTCYTRRGPTYPPYARRRCLVFRRHRAKCI